MAKKYFVGVDLGGASMRAGVGAKDGSLLARKKRKTHPEQGAAKVVERLAEAIEGAVDDAGLKPKDIGGIGVGVPGPVDTERGVVRVAVNLGQGWNNMPLADKLQERLGLKAYIDNDVRVGATGEFTHGAGRDVQDMVAIFVGTGAGGGLVLGGGRRGGVRGGGAVGEPHGHGAHGEGDGGAGPPERRPRTHPDRRRRAIDEQRDLRSVE